MPNVTTNALYATSPFNVDPTQQSAPPLYQPFVTKRLPTEGAYAPDNAESTTNISKMTNTQRMVSLYGLHNETVAFTNPDDGAVLTIAPDFVAARTDNGDAIYYGRRNGAFMYIGTKRQIAARVDGTIREVENGTTVTSQRDGCVVVKTRDGNLHTIAADTFDPQKDLVRTGYLSEEGALAFAQALKDRSLGTLPEIKNEFKLSSTNVLNTAQWLDAQRKATTLEQ